MQISRTLTRLSILLALLLLVTLSACSVTQVHKKHSLIQADLSLPHATVYFIRPQTEHPLGLADNSLGVEIDNEKLISLVKGEYAMVRLTPRDVSVTLRNLTQTRGRWEVEEMARNRSFSFKSGETYFVVADMINGEFRGVRYVPKGVNQLEAKKISRHLRPSGQARKAKIADL